MRRIAMAGCLVLAAALAACSAAGTTPGSSPSPGSGEAGPTPSASEPSASEPGAEPGTGAASPPAGTTFVLTEGIEHDVCGIGLIVTFIPPSAAAGTLGQAFLVGGPVGKVHASPAGDQPLPANVAPARPGATVTVLGKRFKVILVDVTRSRVSLEALC